MIVLGIDPGSRSSGWALLEARTNAGDYPRFSRGVVLARGVGVSYLDRGSFGEASSGELVALLTRLETTRIVGDKPLRAELLVVVEAVEGFAFAPTSKRGGGQAVVAALMATSRVVGELLATAKAGSWTAVSMTARAARSRTLGRGNATDIYIANSIAKLVAAWPSRSNVHQRDAALVALAAIWTMGKRSVADVARAGLE